MSPTHGARAEVVVVGAGPTGLTLACELRRRGVQVTVVERRAAPSVQPKALVLWTGALEVLHHLGLAREVERRGLQLTAASYWAQGRRVGHVDFPAIVEDVQGPLCLPQSDVEQLLLDRLRSLGGRVEWNTCLTALDEKTGRVRVTLTGPDGAEQVLDADWVVGCDGAHSAVRDLAGLSLDGSTYPEGFVLVDGRLSGPAPADEVRYLLSPEGVAVVVPLPGGLHRVFVSAPAGGGTDEIGEAEALDHVHHVLDACGWASTRLGDPAWVSRFRVHRKVAPRYRTGRVLLAGDDAHIHSPAGGQGLNTGVQDAAALGWRLAALVRDLPEGLPVLPETALALLDSYESERLPVAHAVARLTDLQTRLWLLRGWVPRQLRDTTLRVLSATGLLARRVVPSLQQTDLDHRSSALAMAGGPQHGVLAGRRMPRTPLRTADGRRVTVEDLLVDPRPLLLVLTGSQPSPQDAADVQSLVAEATTRCRDELHIELVSPGPQRATALGDLDGRLHAQLGAIGSQAVLVRPDGHVAGRRAARTGAELLTSPILPPAQLSLPESSHLPS